MSDSLTIQPVGAFDVTIADLPGSKSLTNRVLLLAALAEGESTLTNVLFSDDSRAMLDALGRLGFELRINEPTRTVTVVGCGGAIPNKTAELMLGNAGTAMRFLTAACALGPDGCAYTLDGIPRMRERPIGQLVEPLRVLGANIEYLGNDGYPPMRIGTGFEGGSVQMPPTLSSQYISALLQAGAVAPRGVVLHFEGPIISRPYVEMTARLMEKFGVEVARPSEEELMGVEAGSRYVAADYAIEPDASNASYFLAAAAVVPGARCTVQGLGSDSLQGDIHFANLLGQMGADVEFYRDSITVVGSDSLDGIDVYLNDMPDMAQTLAVVALFARGGTVMRDIGNLRVKETDRLAALDTELTKLGAAVKIDGDDLYVDIETPGRLRPAAIDTYDDHRMAMAFAVAGLRCEGVTINDPACVNKTFPEYFEYLARLG